MHSDLACRNRNDAILYASDMGSSSDLACDNERMEEDLWTTAVPGGPGMSLEDILKKMGVKTQ